MNVEWRGPSDVTLHRLGREELLRQFGWVRANTGDFGSSEVVVINRRGERTRVAKVGEEPAGVFLYPVDDSTPQAKALLEMAPMMGSDMKVLDFDELSERLEGCSSDDVWLQWPDGDPKTVVGKVFAVKVGDSLVVSLTPVPKDIEEVNREVHRRVAEKCELAKTGMECGACPLVAGCEALKEVDDEITEVRDGLQQEHEGRGAPDVPVEGGHQA